MKNFTKILFAALLLSFSFILATAQQKDTLEIQRNAKGEISFARFKLDKSRTIQNAVSFLKTVLHAAPNDEFRLIKKTTDKLGITHLKYQQYYKGIKVEEAQYLVHGKKGIIETINGHFLKVNIPSVVPSLTEQQALDKALSYVNAKKYKWQDTAMERFIKQRTNNPQGTYYPKGELVISRDRLNGSSDLRLAWKFTISSLIPNNEQYIYVDAVTGEIIGTTPLILDANSPCTAQTMYSGTLGITGDSFTGGYRLRESRNGVSIETLNLNGTYDYAHAIDFTNTNTNWTTGSWTNIAQDQQALDAHWGAEMVLDYWRIVQSRNSLDGNGNRIISYVHAGAGWNNAQWVGGSGNHFMQYGDGDGTIFHPLTALDVCAHEMGHGINEFTANLGVSPGLDESDALNEGFSDIWGACVEHWAAPAKQTWLIGEEILATPTFDCLRNLQNPNDANAAEGPHPDTYQGQFWDYNGEPHTNSTVLSHWFYLLVQGGSGTNDNGDTYAVTGIGINEAQNIAYRAESMYLYSSATYYVARNATIQAARDLFGESSCEVVATTNAWYAVGVGSSYHASFEYSQYSCSTGRITIDMPGASSYSWSVNGDLLIDGTSTTKMTTQNFIDVTGTNGNVQVTYTLPCVGNVISYGAYQPFVRTIQYAPPGPPLFPGDQLSVSIDPVEFANNYKWYLNDQLVAQGEPQYCTCDYPENPVQCGLNTIRVDVVTDCGTFTSAEDEFEMECYYVAKKNGTHYTITPNPAQSFVIISISSGEKEMVSKGLQRIKENSKSVNGINIVKIFDVSGKLAKQHLFSGNPKQVHMDISKLSDGIYFVEISDGKYKETRKLIISR